MVDGHTKTMMLGASLAAVLLIGGAIAPPVLAAVDAAGETAIAEAPAESAELPRFVPAETESVPVVQAISETPAEAVTEAARALSGGVASWYGPGFAGRKTASGERFDPSQYTAAHRTLPFGSKVRVTRGNRSVVVRINDRGPFTGGRVIDLSQAAAEDLGIRGAGSGQVELALLD